MNLQVVSIQTNAVEDTYTIDLGWGTLKNVSHDTLVSRSKLERRSMEGLGRTLPWYTPSAWYDLIEAALKDYHQRKTR